MRPRRDAQRRAGAVVERDDLAANLGSFGQSRRPRDAQRALDIGLSGRGVHPVAPVAVKGDHARGGHRAIAEEPDRFRTCFERDLDRIHHSKAFRRLAGKCQVFLAPEDDHIRTRLTHAIEVCQVAVSIARPVGLNVALPAAAATGHDCGHGPAGHASEGALSPFVEGGYHHAVYGADVVLAPLNLCHETLDAIRNHSWNRPAPATPEGEVVAWADRIAYVCHDFEDAVAAMKTLVEEAAARTQPLDAAERGAKAGLLNRQVTLR